MRHTITTALALCGLAYPLLARAQVPAEPAPGDAGALAVPDAPAREQLTPPRLLQSVEPVYPEAERQSGRAASVGLVLTLDADGMVVDASVSESAGGAFDASARSAARQLRFSPALRGNTPMGSKIAFRFDFQIAPAAPAAPTPVPAPLSAPPAPQAALVETTEGALDVEVAGERRAREPTRRVLEMEEITKIPGTNGDALRAIQNLPGIARAPGLDGVLIVRGSSPRDSQVFMDGTNIPLAYHFGGLSSVVPSEMLDHIDFYPGNFGPEYGRATGGIIDIGSRAPKKEGYGGLLQVDLIDARLLGEVALSDDTRVLISGRRSWLDAWLGSALEGADVAVSTAPVYYDYQAMIEHDVTESTTLRLFGFGSDDQLKLLIKSPDPSDPAGGGDVSLHTGFWRVQGRADTRLGHDARWTTSISVGQDIEQFNLGSIKTDIDVYRLDLRSELGARLLPELSVRGGFDVQTGDYDVIWRAPPIVIDDGDTSGPLFGRPLTELRADGTFLHPGAHAQAEVTPVAGLSILPGVRADYTKDAEQWTVAPRLAVRYDLPGVAARTTLKAGAGSYHKPPEPYESMEPFGSPGVKNEHAWHYSFGVEQELMRAVELSVEGFYKDLDELIVSAPAGLETESGVSYANLGVGRAYGGEFLLRYRSDGPFFGWVAYTLSRSELKGGASESWELFDFDQTHILTALGSVKLGRGWQVGARFRYVSGSPYTPYTGGIADHDAGVYSPLLESPANQSRLSAFHQLDLRVDKTWSFQSWKLSAYLDVQNVYNRQNSEDITANYDYSESEPLPGLPLLPVLGIRGEL